MVKAHSRINWENYPSDATPLNEANLNKIDVALDEVDNRVITLDTTKLDKTTAATMVKDVAFNESTGVFTITYLNGATITLDTKLEKLAVNFGYDPEAQQLIIILDDETEQYVDLSALITVYEFLDSDTIAFSVDDAGKVSAIVKEGSIEEKHLQPNYLADIKVEVAKAESAVESAEESANLAKSYAVGTDGAVREGDSTDNAKNYYERTKGIAEGIEGAFFPMGTIEFAQLESVDKEAGYMYNIKDEFVTDDRFKEGAGYTYPAGTNVYWTADDYWDCLTGPAVTGVKGDSEADYRRGYVNITPDNIGLGNVDNTSDADKPISTATQNALNDKQDSLGFTPVQQGGGASQLTNKIYIGWKSGSKLGLQVDTTDLGNIALERDAFIHRGWLTNGVSILTLSCGSYQTSPNNLPAEGLPSWCNQYGSVVINGGGYLQIIYSDVFGNIGFYNTQQGGWVQYLLASASCNKNWVWSEGGTQPAWVWGGEDPTNEYVYNPLNFNVESAKYLLSGISGAGYNCLLTNKGNFRPNSYWDANGNASNANGVIGLGTSDYRWQQVCAASSSIVTSDRNQKDDIKPLEDWHYQFFLELAPVSFTFKDGTSGRTHVGFVSQDVEDALAKFGKTALDFAGFCKDVKHKYYTDDEGNEIEEEVLDDEGNPIYIYSLRYEEFIALIAHALQITIARMDEQDKRMDKQDAKIAALEEKIAAL